MNPGRTASRIAWAHRQALSRRKPSTSILRTRTGRILIALTRGARIGVDLERVDANVDIFEVAQANFAPGEIRAIKAAPSFAQATLAFYRIWTGKEALLKAHGSGLLTPLNGFDLGSMNTESEQCYTVGPPNQRSTYYLRGLKLDHDVPNRSSFVAALALSTPKLTVESHWLTGTSIQALLGNVLMSHGR